MIVRINGYLWTFVVAVEVSQAAQVVLFALGIVLSGGGIWSFLRFLKVPDTHQKLIRETEYQSDHLDWQSRERQEAKPLSRDTRQADVLAQRERTEIRNRDRSYSLRPSEIHTLTEVGKLRVVAVEDRARHAYAGDCSRPDSDLRNLIQQFAVCPACCFCAFLTELMTARRGNT